MLTIVRKSPVERAIAHAVVAGSLRSAARATPEAARGLLRAAERHHEEAAKLTALLVCGP